MRKILSIISCFFALAVVVCVIYFSRSGYYLVWDPPFMTYENLRSIIKTEPKLIEELVLSNGHPRFLIKLKDGRELQLLNPSVNQLEELCDLSLTQEIPFKYCCKSKAH